uniref:Uncharacterized protein n=1 Tax=Amphimedon queenslandica TaxID=400682 RepID=A0A1X7TNT5_AMPQE
AMTIDHVFIQLQCSAANHLFFSSFSGAIQTPVLYPLSSCINGPLPSSSLLQNQCWSVGHDYKPHP